MTFLDNLAAGGNIGVGPINQNAPSALTAMNNKYQPQTVAALHSTFSEPVATSFIKWELARAQRGISPLSTQQSIKVLRAAQTRQPVTQPQQRNPSDLLGNIASDVGDIVSSIPKMPGQIAHDILDLPNFNKRVQEGGGGLEGVLNAPVVRLIPGAYTARNVVTGNVGEALSHPVMTALDVLPAAHALHLGERVGAIPVGQSTVAETTARAGAALGRTLPGQFFMETFSKPARATARLANEAAASISEAANPNLARVNSDALSRLAQQGTVAAAAFDRAVPDPARAAEITNAARTGTLDSIPLNDAEAAAVQRVKDAGIAYQQYGLDSGSLAQRAMQGVPEVFTTRDAARIDLLRASLARRETITGLRGAILNPDTADLADLHNRVAQQVTYTAQTLGRKKAILSGLVHAYDAAGYDTGTLLAEVSRSTRANVEGLVGRFDTLQPGEAVTRRTTGQPPLEPATRWLETHRGFTDRSLAGAQRRAAAGEARVLPARWQPLFQQLKLDRVRASIEQTIPADSPDLPGLLAAAHEHVYSSLDPADLRAMDREILGTITELRAAGVDPTFVHNVSPEAAERMTHPTVTSMIPKVSQYATRLNDWTPSVDSLSVALRHQGMELLRNRGARAFLDEFSKAYTRPLGDVLDELRPLAERSAARRGSTVPAELERLLRRQYVRFSDTENGFLAGRSQAFKYSELNYRDPTEPVIPRYLSRELERMASPSPYSRVLDPVTRVFRYSVLPFSPRFHVNNLAGNTISGLLEDPRIFGDLGKGFRFARDIHQMNHALATNADYTLPESTAAILETMPKEMRSQLGALSRAYEPDQEFRVKAGGKLGEMAQAAGVNRLLRAGKNAADWSFEMNELADTAYRTAAYINERGRSLVKGLSEEEATARGVALANKFMPRWNELTPMERSVFRVVFPFYPFLQHVMRFAFRYPIDHPFRVSVMASLARNELSDFGTGLPQTLARAFFLGGVDAKGNQKILDIGAANPFRDLGDNLTLAGFLGQTNPVFKTVLRALGYDTTARGPNIYPEIEYDPTTGGMRAVQPSTPGLLGGLATDIIPPIQVLQALTGTSAQFKSLMQTNPDAARRMMLSQAGIPLIYKSVNLPEQSFRSELARQKDQQAVLSQALKSGDYTRALRYPSLAPLIQQLQVLNQRGALKPYQGGTQQQSQVEARLG